MKLDRNINEDGTGKYALVKMRDVAAITDPVDRAAVSLSLDTLERLGVLDYGDLLDNEFFVMRTRDKYSGPGLRGYEDAARKDGETEYADEVGQIALNAETHPAKKKPTENPLRPNRDRVG